MSQVPGQPIPSVPDVLPNGANPWEGQGEWNLDHADKTSSGEKGGFWKFWDNIGKDVFTSIPDFICVIDPKKCRPTPPNNPGGWGSGPGNQGNNNTLMFALIGVVILIGVVLIVKL